jgi:hypothetical protein
MSDTTNQDTPETPAADAPIQAASDPAPETTDTAPVEAPPEATTATDDPAAPVEDVATDPPADDTARPWHGATNPLESLWQHFTSEIAALKAKIGG